MLDSDGEQNYAQTVASSAGNSDPLPDSFGGGRYQVRGLLGEGSQGSTFDASDTKTGARVAVKRFQIRGARSWKDVELAEREARVLASLSHPRVPKYVDHFEENGALFLVTEHIEGETLQSLRKRGKTLSEEDVWRFLEDAGELLAYLHNRAPPVVHRDIKPGNVILRPDGRFALIDFGAVRDKLKIDGGSTVVGTFGYMAPEQFQGRARGSADVYAVGVTALHLLSGVEPEDLPHRGLAIDVEATLGSSASRELRAVLARMLDPDPDRRATNLAALVAAANQKREAARTEPASLAGLERGKPSASVAGPRTAGAHGPSGARGAETGDTPGPAGRSIRYGGSPEPGDRPNSPLEPWVNASVRAQMRAARRSSGAIPWPVRVLLVFGLVTATISVAISTQLIVPLVLRLLAILFGKPLLRAAETVRRAGASALEVIRDEQDRLTGEPPTRRARAQSAERDDERADVRVDVERTPAREKSTVNDAERDDEDSSRDERRKNRASRR